MLEELIKYVSVYQNIPENSITKDTHLVKDLGMSSLDMMELACSVEEQFGIEFDEDDLIDLLTIEKIANYVEKELRGE